MLQNEATQAASELPHLLIIGGGITGLSAAHALQAAGCSYTLVEQQHQLGGKIRSELVEQNGRFVVEAGPDSLLTQKPWGLALVRELGLAPRMIGSNQHQKTVYVYSRGKIEPMPAGLLLAVPLKFWPFARSRLLSPWGRLRAALDLVLPAQRDPGDESLGGFIRRRFGRELLERIAEPLMAGIHNAECERQSLLATFPRFHAAERQHGSVIRQLRAEQRRNQAQTKTPTTVPSAFISFEHGLQELVDALAASLTGQIRLGCTAVSIACDPLQGGYLVELNDGSTLRVDGVIVTTPAPVAAQLLAPLAPELAEQLRAIRYVSTATVSLAYRAEDMPTPLDGYGMLVPRIERRQINALTMASVKWAGRAPDGSVLLRVFVGGSHNPAVLAQDDAGMLATVRTELRDLLGINAPPLFTRIFRWNEANPQYDLGHLDRVANYERLCPEGIVLAGCAYRGVGIPDCIHQGQQAAGRVAAHVEQQDSTIQHEVRL
ncbi:MAG: protoporphyrinogen oxidase [Roseiflexaceae bacterium]|nr:protoporphyrinogen oxidase [Roseiflexaceae bacterium]